ncbi:hypothetical protein BHM03_00000249 [Ensete ventricosum]|uniref:Uncharacterized protein n=1 Tax=Ensete ventricosum TaxID=4639 RepID=A0A426Z181_ENSVE|nr:hypothetical protein B296_00012873 [Ensete ventricosum]RZR75763.1 hypothetical protein BHM03_00000249 [Ensete ventricosum]
MEETRSITSGSSKRRSSRNREIGELKAYTATEDRAWEGESGLGAKITSGNRRLRRRIYRVHCDDGAREARHEGGGELGGQFGGGNR